MCCFPVLTGRVLVYSRLIRFAVKSALLSSCLTEPFLPRDAAINMVSRLKRGGSDAFRRRGPAGPSENRAASKDGNGEKRHDYSALITVETAPDRRVPRYITADGGEWLFSIGER
jgi:hypothetical protein